MELNLFKLGAVDQIFSDFNPMQDFSVDPIYKDALLDVVIDHAPPPPPVPVADAVQSIVYLYLHFKDKKSSEDLAVNGKLVYIPTGEVLSTITDSIEAEIKVFDVAASDLVVEFGKQGFKTVKANVSDLLNLPDPKTIEFARANNFMYLELAAVAALIYFATNRKKKVGALSKEDIMPWLMIGGGLLAFSLVNKILTSLGIWKSKDTKDLDDASTNSHSFWNPNFWKTIKPANAQWSHAITTATATQWVVEMQDAFGAFNDCEECAISIMKRCQTKATASFFADVFQQETGQDLLTYLRGGWWPQDRLSDADVATINNFIKTLPDY